MSKNEWTKNQLDAINVKSGPVLVSAAAGAGKTAVLVERVIRLLTDINNACDADKLLIVTFTKAAAAEMKERIYSRISEMLSLDPENIILQRQQLLLSNAHISTIHSFCNDIIKEYFYKIDNLSPDFRIADENEMITLKNDAVQLVLEEKYKKASKDFLNLVETFSSTHDDQNLVSTILKIYDFIRAHPFSKEWLNDKLNLYNQTKNINETVFSQILYDYAIMSLAYCENLTQNSLNLINGFDKLKAAYKETLFQDKHLINNLQAAVNTKNWNKISSGLKLVSFSTLKRVSGHSEDTIKQKILQSRQEVKSIIKNLTQLFFQDEKQSLNDLDLIRPIISELFDLVNLFSLKINSLKNDKSIVDFADLEHLTLQLLIKKTENGFEKRDLAYELSKRFEFVMVDEYQDTNEAQDMIFRSVSNNEKNLFVVGDVKQSIYGFRQAMPQIFLRRKQKYQMFDAKKENYPSKIILDKNFRSKTGIIGIINFMFSQLMSNSVGEIEYNKEEKLVFGADYEEKNRVSADVELKIIDISDSNTGESMNVLEAKYVSEMILKMIGEKHKIKCGKIEKTVTYGDFCILLRSANKHSSEFVETLRLYGIPAWADTSGDFFETVEIITILSLLKIIDNPIQDVPLLSVLMSPIFAFTPDELSEIRMIDRELPIYFAIKKYSDFGHEKCKNFLNIISKYRNLAATWPSDKLIQYIYDDTAYIYIVQAMSDGETRINNLRLLLEHARTCEASGYKGLTGFIRFASKLEEQKINLSTANPLAENANVVKVMSIHRSKGLEFPICILANCSRKFNKDTGAALLHPDLGPGVKLLDRENMRKYTTIQRDAIKLDMDKKSISEELRILYVAMTRAKEKLIMITSLKNIESTLSKLSLQLTSNLQLPSYVVGNSSSFSDWILLCALRHPKGNCIRQLAGIPSIVPIDDETNLKIDIINLKSRSILGFGNKAPDNKEKIIDKKFLNEINSRINYVYKYRELSKIPSKITVSELVASKDNLVDLDFSKSPAFLLEHKPTPAQKGSAMHIFMQYANLEEAKKNLDKEINNLLNKGFLLKEEKSVLDKAKISKFLNSSLCKRILASKNVFREFRFTVNINASEVISEINQKFGDEKIVLQGAIDCAFEENNSLVIIDYKTDKLSLEELKSRYEKQLTLYSRALSECAGKTVSEKILYSFYTGTQILL